MSANHNNHLTAPAVDHEELKRVQDCGFRILLEFDRVARELGIQYFLIYGTLLGARRHGGFIPWDDDIDVGVPRPDYERLLASGHLFRAPYLLESYTRDGSYVVPIAKVFDTGTTVIEDDQAYMKRGVWIDIFPIDGTFESSRGRNLHFAAAKAVHDLFRYRTRSLRARDFLGKRFGPFKAAAYGVASLFPVHAVYRMFQSVCKLVPLRKARYAGVFFFTYGQREFMPREVFFGDGGGGSRNELEFNGVRFPVPADVHAYLHRIYGDYMKLPPLEKRVPHPVLYRNLGESYLTHIPPGFEEKGRVLRAGTES